MAEKNIRMIDVATDPKNIESVDTITRKELIAQAELGEFDECSIVLLPENASVVIATADPSAPLMYLLPGFLKENSKHQIYWLRLNTVYQSKNGNSHGNNDSENGDLPAKPKAGATPPSRKANGKPPLPQREQTARINSDSMTENQRRFLFRLLAERDCKGSKAKEYLLDYFEVESIKNVSKKAASELIEQLVDGG